MHLHLHTLVFVKGQYGAHSTRMILATLVWLWSHWTDFRFTPEKLGLNMNRRMQLTHWQGCADFSRDGTHSARGCRIKQSSCDSPPALSRLQLYTCTCYSTTISSLSSVLPRVQFVLLKILTAVQHPCHWKPADVSHVLQHPAFIQMCSRQLYFHLSWA